MNSEITIVWLRNDLRLEDNPALYHANKFAKKKELEIGNLLEIGNWKSGSKFWMLTANF